MSAKRKIPFVWLLGANIIAVVVLIAVGNWWWMERLEHLDQDIKRTVSASSESSGHLLELLERQLPLQQLLSQSTLNTVQFIDELELLVIDAARDYTRLESIQQAIARLPEQVEGAWPAKMNRTLLDDYLVNMAIIGDIVEEVLATSSPNQLQLLAEDSRETLSYLLSVLEQMEQSMGRQLAEAEQRTVEMNQSLQTDIAHVDSYISNLKQQTLIFALSIICLLLLVQLVVFRMLKSRLEGLGKVMRDITTGGSLGQRVSDAQERDLVGYLGMMFNAMLDRLQTAQQSMQEEKERAEAATQAKSDFLANMSHEIRTPVHAITSLVHLMREQQLSPKLRSYVDKTDSATEALLHVINDVLDFSKIAEGKLELECQPFALAPSLEKMIDLFNSKFNDKGLDLTLLIHPDVPNLVVGDRLRLNQILINLINNAFKFTSSGAVAIEVSCETAAANRVTLAFAVADTGIGIAHEKIGGLFDAFSQADASTTRKYGGTGLGLSISRHLATLMGGDIKVVSEPQQGSTFTLYAQFELGNHMQPYLPPLPQAVQGTRVLLVSPSPHQQYLLQQLLADWGLASATVNSLDDAMGRLTDPARSSGFELLLVDLPPMEELSIHAVLQTIYRHNQLLDLPVVFISHLGLEEETAREVFIVDRPTKPSELFRSLVQALGIKDVAIESLDEESLNRKRRQRIQEQIAGARVLVVEDVAINQQIAKEVLSRAGLSVSLADNGQEALAILERETFDLVLMDLQMPVMGGLEATSLIRRQLQLDKLPVVAMTANVIKGAVEECLEAGCNDYLSKPLDMDQLWRVLGQWIEPGERDVTVSGEYAVVESQDQNLPEQLPGLDVSAALVRLGGNDTLYRSLLEDFSAKYIDAGREVAQCIAGQDIAGAERLAHAVKGAGANLGMVELSQAAEAIELLGKRVLSGSLSQADTEDFESLLEDFDHHLGRVTASVAQLTGCTGKEPAVASEATGGDSDMANMYGEIKPALVALAALIQDSDAESLECFEQIKTSLSGLGLQSLLQVLEGKLYCFSFDEAAEALAELIRYLETKEQESNG